MSYGLGTAILAQDEYTNLKHEAERVDKLIEEWRHKRSNTIRREDFYSCENCIYCANKAWDERLHRWMHPSSEDEAYCFFEPAPVLVNVCQCPCHNYHDVAEDKTINEAYFTPPLPVNNYRGDNYARNMVNAHETAMKRLNSQKESA